jgi:guanylate kinase
MTRGPLIILSGPSAAGKSTVVNRLLATIDVPLRQSVSVTTRTPRPDERNGVHYHFWTPERFEEELQAGRFLEWADVYGNRYGTLRGEVDRHREQGVGVILAIDVRGWEQVKALCPEAVSIFLRTSAPEMYEKRLRERDRDESEAVIQRRLQAARSELARAAEYDHQVINDDLDKAVADLREIIRPLFKPSGQ